MTKAFVQKVTRHGIVDTKTYRYIWKDGHIYRIALDLLDTVAVLDKENWEEMYQ